VSATHSTNWFWTDWLGDISVRRLTPTERGVWIDLLALASTANPIGYVCDAKGTPLTLEEIARVTNAASPHEVEKLISGIVEKGAASIDRKGRLFNRRMVREAEIRAKKAQAGKRGAARTNMIFKEKTGPPRHLPRQDGNGEEDSSSVVVSGTRGSVDTRARESVPIKEPLISQAAHDLADAYRVAVRVDPDDPSWHGLAYTAQIWVDRGYDRSELLAIGAGLTARMGQKPMSYHAKTVDREFLERLARQSQPQLPLIGVVKTESTQQEPRHAGASRSNVVQAGLNRVAELREIAKSLGGDGPGCDAGKGDLGDGKGDSHVRLLAQK
jgi:hypothetical protein